MPDSLTSSWFTLRVLNYMVLAIFTAGLFINPIPRFFHYHVKKLSPIGRFTLMPYVAIVFSCMVLVFLAPLYIGFVNHTSKNAIDMIILSINAIIGATYTFIVYAFLTAPKGKVIVCKAQSIIAIFIAYYLDRYFHDRLFHGRPWLAMMFVFLVAMIVYHRFFINGKPRGITAEDEV